MADNVNTVETASATLYWPWLVAGLLSTAFSSVLARWLPPYFTAGISFFFLFTAASSIVSRRMHHGDARFARNVAASASGAVVVAVLKYLFP
jgi:hypothetical protein